VAVRQAIHLVEILDGVRPVGHLAGRVAPIVSLRLQGLTSRAKRHAGDHPHGRHVRPVRVRRVHSTRPSGTSFEASVVLEHAGRVRAIAVRMELHHGAWRTTELSDPDCGFPALRTASNPVAPVFDDEDDGRDGPIAPDTGATDGPDEGPEADTAADGSTGDGSGPDPDPIRPRGSA
jgi:hypothetical protein